MYTPGTIQGEWGGKIPYFFFTFAMPKVCLNYIATKMRHALEDTRDKTKYWEN